MRAGDQSAHDELLAHAAERLFRLGAENAFAGFPGRTPMGADRRRAPKRHLAGYAAALGEVPLLTVADFFRLAAAQIRRELIDLARRLFRPLKAWMPTMPVSPARARLAPGSPKRLNPADTTHDPGRLAGWTDFHREIEALPAIEREAFDLLFYQGLSQLEAAALLDVSERTIKRRWQAARLRLVQALGGKMPGL